MKITDPIGDMITRIRNGQMRGLKKVSVPGSKLRKAVLDVLEKEGFIQEYTVSKDKSFETIEINLKAIPFICLKNKGELIRILYNFFLFLYIFVLSYKESISNSFFKTFINSSIVKTPLLLWR